MGCRSVLVGLCLGWDVCHYKIRQNYTSQLFNFLLYLPWYPLWDLLADEFHLTVSFSVRGQIVP